MVRINQKFHRNLKLENGRLKGEVKRLKHHIVLLQEANDAAMETISEMKVELEVKKSSCKIFEVMVDGLKKDNLRLEKQLNDN